MKQYYFYAWRVIALFWAFYEGDVLSAVDLIHLMMMAVVFVETNHSTSFRYVFIDSVYLPYEI